MQRKIFYFLQYFDNNKNIWKNECVCDDREIIFEKYYNALNAFEKYRIVEEVIFVKERKFLTQW